MIPFRATYTPIKINKFGESDGYDKGMASKVLVISIKIYDRETNPDVVFIESDGKLNVAGMNCISECEWKE